MTMTYSQLFSYNYYYINMNMRWCKSPVSMRLNMTMRHEYE